MQTIQTATGTFALPRLKQLGTSDADLDRILIDNPRSLFTNAAAQLMNADRRLRA